MIPEGKNRNVATPQGSELGDQLARLCDNAEKEVRKRHPEIPERCASCAFRQGGHLPNNSPFTLMDALKCLMERVPFECHETNRNGDLCAGFAILTITTPDAEPIEAPWPFSTDENDNAENGE